MRQTRYKKVYIVPRYLVLLFLKKNLSLRVWELFLGLLEFLAIIYR